MYTIKVYILKKIYSYDNYRRYLSDMFKEKKDKEGYTYRDFSKSLGVNSPSWLPQVIKGERNLTPRSTERVANAFHLSKRERSFFEYLVGFTQAKDSKTKDEMYRKMLGLKKQLRLNKLEENQYQLYTKWYFPVIRSLVSKIDFGNDYKLLGNAVNPKISALEAKQAVKLLEKSGFIKKDPSGRWAQVTNMLSTGDEVDSLNVINFHKSMSKIAIEAFDNTPKIERDISSLTIGINRKDFNLIKTELQEFRKKILSIAQSSEPADSVYQVNLQLFPLTKNQYKAGGDV